KLVGNAVSVPVAKWVGERLVRKGTFHASASHELWRGAAWPRAAWGYKGHVFTTQISMWPVCGQHPHLSQFLRFPCAPLSVRAAAGFLSRARMSTLKFEDGFLDSVARHIERMRCRHEPVTTVRASVSA